MKAKRPVKDIKIDGEMTVDDLMVQLKQSGGFTGRKLSEAVDIVEKMVRKDGCTDVPIIPCLHHGYRDQGGHRRAGQKEAGRCDHHYLRHHGP